MLYNIAGLWLYYESENQYFEERCKAFQMEISEKNIEKCDICISAASYKKVRRPQGIEVMKGAEPAVIRKNPPLEGYYIYSLLPTFENGVLKRDRIPQLLDTDPNWSNIRIKYICDDSLPFINNDCSLSNWNEFSSFLLAGVAFRYRLIKKNGLLIHSSSIEYKGKGLIFSAPSGTGKSTHVRLWQELYGDAVTIINEDRPAIRYIDDMPLLCGTPWSGSSDYFTNKNVPLSGIVMLEQAPQNSIEILSGPKVVQLLMPRCFLPYFDAGMMIEALNTLERLVNDVPVYLLKCRPDYEAVELVQKCLI